ncbi:MAG TPA: response regulator [Verrucomicrobiae bacterium]|jgi:two-component system cell cycle sensor histidine kinase/response regulator CckA|nr:response regulator [Verrucomicrobiae bacterium]
MSSYVSAPSPNAPVILLVEDESMVREITGQVLSHAGYRVLESASAREALQKASEHDGRIDLLLTDVVMPEMNGADLAHQMLDQQPDLITIFMSGYAEHDVLRKMKMTSARHIQKPFTVDTLLSRVAEALDEGGSVPASGFRA